MDNRLVGARIGSGGLPGVGRNCYRCREAVNKAVVDNQLHDVGALKVGREGWIDSGRITECRCAVRR